MSLKARALRALAQREHSRLELARKLQPHADATQPPAALEALLDELQAQGWLSDARFAEAWSRNRAQRQGVARIRAELRQRGVEAGQVEQATAALADTEAERAQQVWQKKFGQPARDATERARQIRFLLGRGFDTGLACRVVPKPQPRAAGPEASPEAGFDEGL
ncbi:MAG: recombination regulator RecX [Pseudomonadota bacterium]|jgi:regulatory protein